MGLLDLWLVPYMDLSYEMDLDNDLLIGGQNIDIDHEGLNLYLDMVTQ